MRFSAAVLCVMLLLGTSVHLVSQDPSAPQPSFQELEPERVCFEDLAPDDPTLVDFRKRLLDIVRRRDRAHFLAAVASDVLVGLQGAKGLGEFEKVHDLETRNSEFWKEMEDILTLGGRFFRPGLFCAPYVSCPGPRNGNAEHVVILGSRVAAYDRPTESSRVVAELSCDVLRVSGSSLPEQKLWGHGFTPVFLNVGRWAYVKNEMVRSPAWYSAHFEKRHGKWYLVAFLAGD